VWLPSAREFEVGTSKFRRRSRGPTRNKKRFDCPPINQALSVGVDRVLFSHRVFDAGSARTGRGSTTRFWTEPPRSEPMLCLIDWVMLERVCD